MGMCLSNESFVTDEKTTALCICPLLPYPINFSIIYLFIIFINQLLGSIKIHKTLDQIIYAHFEFVLNI